MRTLYYLLQKEFLQMFRDPGILRTIFIMPIIQLVLLPFAADYEIKNMNLSVVDGDHSTYSRRMIDKIVASGYFKLTDYSPTYQKAAEAIEHDRADLVVVIPDGFERNLVREGKTTVQLAVNAVNGVKGGMAGAYAGRIIQEFNQEIILNQNPLPRLATAPNVEIVPRFWFNENMNYKFFMVPGILGILVTMVGSFLASANIVKEKEMGTIEQLNVTPIQKWQFILGKLVPFWVLGMMMMSVGMVVARLVFGIAPLAGWTGYLSIYAFAAIYLSSFLGFGLLISTLVDTQQQSMFIAFFFMMIFVLMGGLYTNVDSMPEWAKWIVRFNPPSYFIEVSRMIFLKGSTLVDVVPQILKTLAFGVVFNTLAIWNYKKRS
jgi:ABC-2 type transport system permease protein